MMKKDFVSVVIPTFNRLSRLKSCLSSFTQQKFPKEDFEIIVVDDGSAGDSIGIARDLKSQISISKKSREAGNLKLVRQKHQGPAAAKNKGIKIAKGEIILFIQDDMMADSYLLQEHARIHQKYSSQKVAVLGHIDWHPKMKITPFLDWLVNGGPLTYYWLIKDTKWVDWWFFYGNVSVKRNFLLKHGIFDEQFRYMEDGELAFRLQKRGLKIFYNTQARVFHYHPTTLRNYKKRMGEAGKYTRMFNEKHRETPRKGKPSGFKNFLVKQLNLIRRYPYPKTPLLPYRLYQHWHWHRLLQKEFHRGYRGDGDERGDKEK